MKKLSILFLWLALASCGLLKKSVYKSDVDTSTNIESTLKADVTTKTDTKTNKEIKTVITEKIDTNVIVPGTTASVTRPIAELLEGGVIEASNGETSVKVTYDPTTGSVKAEGKTAKRNVPVKSTKTTVVEADYKSATTTDKAEQIDNTFKAENKTAVETTNKDIDREGNKSVFMLFGFMLLVVIIFIIAKYLASKFS